MSDVNPCFSEDIWFEILKNLPVKTLGKCRCVCKSWHSLIVSLSFMAAHFKHYTRNDANSLILCKVISKCTKTKIFEQCIFFRDLVQLKLGNRLHTSDCPIAVPHNYMLSAGIYIVDSINGLLCISDRNRYADPRILIWNPLIQKSIELPKSRTDKDFVLGFGYDFLRNDHRVVKISYSDTNRSILVEVYSVQERTWNTICPKYLVDNSIRPMPWSLCFTNGVIHWRSNIKCMLCFNVSEETFTKMEYPEELLKRPAFPIGLFDYQGCLSVSRCGNRRTVFNSDYKAYCDIWVKRDYNVKSSWCKILAVEILYDVYNVGAVEYLGENEELIGLPKKGSEELVSYDPKTKQITELGLYASESTKFSAYSESLTLLDQKTDDLLAVSFPAFFVNVVYFRSTFFYSS